MRPESKGFVSLELALCVMLALITLQSAGIALNQIIRNYRRQSDISSAESAVNNSSEIAGWRLSSEPHLTQFNIEIRPPEAAQEISVHCQRRSSPVVASCAADCLFRPSRGNSQLQRIYVACTD